MTDSAAADYLYRALGQFRVPGPFLPVRSARPRGSHVYAVASPTGLISVGSSASAAPCTEVLVNARPRM